MALGADEMAICRIFLGLLSLALTFREARIYQTAYEEYW
jgi:hypothetical protein